MLPSAPLLVYAGTQEHEKVAQRIRGRRASLNGAALPLSMHAYPSTAAPASTSVPCILSKTTKLWAATPGAHGVKSCISRSSGLWLLLHACTRPYPPRKDVKLPRIAFQLIHTPLPPQGARSLSWACGLPDPALALARGYHARAVEDARPARQHNRVTRRRAAGSPVWHVASSTLEPWLH
jgi:hypothetical protein